MIILSTEDSLKYIFSGYFESPSPEWIHLTRNLREFELMIVTEGTLYIASADKEFEVPAGQYLLMPPTPYQHGTRPASCKFYWFHFEYLTYESGLPFPLSGICPDIERISPLITMLQEADKTYHNAALNSSILRTLLLSLQCRQPMPSLSDADRIALLCSDIKNYIEWNFFSNSKVSDIAAYFGYHEKYISTLFKKETGNGLKEYILKIKMEHACRALSTTDISINRLALNLGFSDAHNFSTAFRKVTGCSPSAYRRETMGDY